MGKKLAIEHHLIRPNEVIELLEMMGGKNKDNADGCSFLYYTLCTPKINNPNNEKVICGFTNLKMQNDFFAIFTLEEFLEKYPFKVGDVIKFPNNMAEEIAEMKWDEELEDIVYTSVSGCTRPCSVPKNTNNKTNMKNMFIEFDNTLINTNHIIYIESLDGAYNNYGKFAVRCITDKNIKCEWYNTKKQRNERYEYLVNLLSIK